ncbi:hypothetical protein ACN6LC_004660 [Streptomyces violaceoruber]|uniref:hypothetical protein n=1 Tax=Streptomyces violaceoruber TaxID=1935 RepID=UPI00403C49AD
MHDYDGQDVSNRLDRHQRTLDNSLDGALDVEAGLREIFIHSRHDTAVDALGTVLNTEAGLARILPPTPQPQASDTHRHPRARDFLPALSPADRMAVRNRPDVRAEQRDLARALALDFDLPHVLALSLARDLARACARDLSRILDRARDLDRDLSRIRDLAGSFTPFLDPALARNLADARARVLDLDHVFELESARDLARYLELARPRAHDLALALTRGRGRDHVHARDHVLGLGLTLDCALDRALDLARILDLGRAYVLDLDLARNAFIEVRTNEVCRAIGLALHREPPVLDAASVPKLLDDFTDADLSDTDLSGIDLSGVHWSQRTQWPPVVNIEALKARSDETPPGSGVWIVRSGTTTVRDFANLT